ncbi:sigma-70 family RNA polymerase sigma factor [Streptomyces sp. NPDC051597]|uniref:RNA polymerase sigma factor n=1 Tax=Streptomyces sp. NPDC051597 TaxID=3155049 RepID=UPI00341446A4
MTMDDGELVERFRKGDSEATEILWSATKWLKVVARRRLGAGQWAEAEDVVAQAYEALLRSRKPVANPRAWLKEAVTNLVATRFRQLASERRGLSKLWDPDPETCVPLRQAEEQLAAQKLWDGILSALNERECQTLELALEQTVTGRSTREQARELRIAENTLSQRKARAQKSAQAALLVMRWQAASVECPELRQELASSATHVTPALMASVESHLKGCEEPGCQRLRTEWEAPSQHKFVWTLPVLLPSPAMRDRIRNVCDELGTEDTGAKARVRELRRTGGPGTSGAAAGSDGRGTRRDATGRNPLDRPVGAWYSHQQPSRRTKHRVSTTIGACVVAGLVVGVALHKSGSDFAGPLRALAPGIVAPSDTLPGSSGSPGGHTGNPSIKDAGKRGDASGHSADDRDRNGNPGGSGSDSGGNGSHGSQTGKSQDNSHGGDDNSGSGHGKTAGNKGSDDQGRPDDRGLAKSHGDGNVDGTNSSHSDSRKSEDAGVVVPPPDTTGPAVSLSRISTDAVGQVVLDYHGVQMQTCGPAGTPTTYRVWLAASDPSGISHLTLYIQHPTDGTYVSDAGVADGGAIRFDVPDYRATPKPLKTVKLRLTAVAVDTLGHRTDAYLGKLPLYECGEPG